LSFTNIVLKTERWKVYQQKWRLSQKCSLQERIVWQESLAKSKQLCIATNNDHCLTFHLRRKTLKKDVHGLRESCRLKQSRKCNKWNTQFGNISININRNIIWRNTFSSIILAVQDQCLTFFWSIYPVFGMRIPFRDTKSIILDLKGIEYILIYCDKDSIAYKRNYFQDWMIIGAWKVHNHHSLHRPNNRKIMIIKHIKLTDMIPFFYKKKYFAFENENFPSIFRKILQTEYTNCIITIDFPHHIVDV